MTLSFGRLDHSLFQFGTSIDSKADDPTSFPGLFPFEQEMKREKPWKRGCWWYLGFDTKIVRHGPFNLQIFVWSSRKYFWAPDNIEFFHTFGILANCFLTPPPWQNLYHLPIGPRSRVIFSSRLLQEGEVRLLDFDSLHSGHVLLRRVSMKIIVVSPLLPWNSIDQ